MSRSLRFALTFFLAACSGEDAQTDPPPAACVHSPYNGLEPACDFAPGPGSGRSEPAADKLPKPTGSCPAFTDGNGCRAEAGGALTCLFQPAGEPEREVRVWMPPGERVQPGPLVFYFYGLLGWPDNAAMPFAGFPQDVLQKLFDAGGILVAPQARADRNPPKLSRLPWIDALGFEDDMGDFLLIDEVVACAIEQVGIDVRHIHSTGLSAGAWMTAQVAVHRSNYIASVALFSGGIEGIQGTQDPSNKYPVIMFHGGTTDYVGAHFENEAQSGVNLWRTLGHFAVSCNHESGHSVPAQAALAGMQFLLDHPYGTLRSPYCEAAPPEASFCALSTPATLGVVPAASRAESVVAACVDAASAAGLTGPSYTDELLSCACERCGSELEACMADPACLSTIQCAAEKGCIGINCYQDALCAPVIDAAGGPTAASPQLGVAFGDCMGAAACDQCGVPTKR